MDLINKTNISIPISGNDQYVYKASTYVHVAKEVYRDGGGGKENKGGAVK